MRRHVLLAAAAFVAAATLVATAGAAVTPGTYKGFLRWAGKKGQPATVTVVGNKVTIKAAKFPIKCRDGMGRFTRPGGPFAYEWRGTLKKGDRVDGSMKLPADNVAGVVTASGAFNPVEKSFGAVLSAELSGNCRGVWEIAATLP